MTASGCHGALDLGAESLDFGCDFSWTLQLHPTQEEARLAAREIAMNQKSEVLVHGVNGQIRQKNSYGNDPFPSRG